jgi:hypothetical protein
MWAQYIPVESEMDPVSRYADPIRFLGLSLELLREKTGQLADDCPSELI